MAINLDNPGYTELGLHYSVWPRALFVEKMPLKLILFYIGYQVAKDWDISYLFI